MEPGEKCLQRTNEPEKRCHRIICLVTPKVQAGEGFVHISPGALPGVRLAQFQVEMLFILAYLTLGSL